MAANSDNTAAHIGRVVAFHRKVSGLSRVALAELAGIGKTAVYDIEHGKRTVRLETLRRVLVALNITLRLESPLMTQFEQVDAQR